MPLPAYLPEKQGLRQCPACYGCNCFPPSISSRKTRIKTARRAPGGAVPSLPAYLPEKQGLRLFLRDLGEESFRLPAYLPEKQGLRLDGCTKFPHRSATPSISSRKTRIKTLAEKVNDKVLSLPAYLPEKQGLRR